MTIEFLNMKSILNIEKWQEIQDDLASVTKMAIITIDYKGMPITKHSKCTEFCNIVRSDPKTSSLCEKCDARGGIEAVRLGRSYMYRCHCNIVDVAIPIIIKDKYFGAIMAGQVLLKDEKDSKDLEKIYSNEIEVLSNQNKMLFLYSKLPRLSLEDIKETVNLIGNIGNYIFEESIKNYTFLEENQSIAENLEVSNRLGSSLSDILKPALEYIDQNYHEDIKLKDMAKLCYISPGYFSKIFHKETGEKFSDCLIRLRIEKAKKLLKNTNKTIQEIAIEVGFNDSGYFTKRFKKYQGITPGLYRKISK